MKHMFFLFFIVLYVISLLNVEADDEFVKTRGVQLMLNGSPYYANGYNAYWLMYFASDPSQRNKVSSTFQEASYHGLNIARTWAFSDGGYKPLQYSPGSYNEEMFQGLDFVLAEARKYGIKVILSLVNNYEDFGGKKQYVEWARSQGQSINSEDDFFTNPVVKGYYKNHIKTVVTRRNSLSGVAYKDDPTIMAWELMNEIRCPSDHSGNSVQGWISEMASYLKSIDGNHLLEAGLEGFYGQSKTESNPNFQVGTDFIANNQIPTIDFATLHSYPDQWLSNSGYEDQISFLRGWLNEHIQDAQNILHKPLLFAEFGISSKNLGSSNNSTKRDQFFNTVYSAIYSSASGGGTAVGGLFWQLLAEGMDSFRDDYEVILAESPSTATLIAQESQKLKRIRKMYARLKNIDKWNKT
ncbi:putative mannan endo-1,4-beta-mannosidase [Medicago truncatula]|uniref:mannan endo-1,4-beta-mannosidase n=1 Tax=Medicago truncatula TaxID=3880 RepID=A0A072V2A7_MEDTR|nr:mannan endo-1,4-beta-mannosidase 7 [Medicago truncatula]KEH36174.1 mannan endo-1,4-beta-mannosidase-like protein [Medicago truncatula]RHN71021.1 putative mannan endo-1,4-beta-mannosidase [Medicago truncatula]